MQKSPHFSILHIRRSLSASFSIGLTMHIWAHCCGIVPSMTQSMKQVQSSSASQAMSSSQQFSDMQISHSLALGLGLHAASPVLPAVVSVLVLLTAVVLESVSPVLPLVVVVVVVVVVSEVVVPVSLPEPPLSELAEVEVEASEVEVEASEVEAAEVELELGEVFPAEDVLSSPLHPVNARVVVRREASQRVVLRMGGISWGKGRRSILASAL